MSRPDDPLPEHDAHLRAALRHAPDAELAAPAALSAQILRAARAAARSPATGVPRRPARWLDGLAQAWRAWARPPVIAGVASVVLVTVVGLNVWEQPVDPPRPPMAESKVAAAPSPLMVPTEPGAADATSNATPDAGATRAAARGKAAETRRPTAAPAPPDAIAEPASPQRAAAARNATAIARDAAAPDATSPQAPAPAPVAAPAALRATAEAGSLERRAPGPLQPGALADAGPAREAASVGKAAQGSVAAGAGVAPGAADLATDAARAERFAPAAVSAARPSLAALAEALVAEPQRWQVGRGDAPAREVSPAVAAWLTQLDRLAAARWTPSDPSRAEATRASAMARTIELRWEREGVVRHRLWLAADGVLWQPSAGGTGERTPPFWWPVDADTAQRLRASLDLALR